MREILTIQIGQCGNQIGNKYWESMTDDHGIDPTGAYHGKSELQLKCIDTFFEENKRGRYIPRAVLVDLDPMSLDSVRGSPYGRLFNPDNYVHGKNGTGNNWGKGYYTDGTHLMDYIRDIVRKEIEKTDRFEGFQIIHSLGGGTGSGMTSRVLDDLREHYPISIIGTYSIFPSPKVSDVVTETYNACLSINKLAELTDHVQVLDNESLYNICTRTSVLRTPAYNDLNHLVAGAMLGISTCVRFPGQLNTSLRKMCLNLIPFPRLHFLTLAYAPFSSNGFQENESLSTSDLIEQLFDPENLMNDISTKNVPYFAVSLMFRGKVSAIEVDQEINSIRKKGGLNFIEWIADSIKTSFCDAPPKTGEIAGALLGNSRGVYVTFQKLAERFYRMWRRKVFVHWYTAEGMDEMEFVEAESNMNDLVSEYEGNLNMAYPEDDYYDDFEEQEIE